MLKCESTKTPVMQSLVEETVTDVIKPESVQQPDNLYPTHGDLVSGGGEFRDQVTSSADPTSELHDTNTKKDVIEPGTSGN